MVKQPPRNVAPFLVGLSVGLLIGIIVIDLLLPTGVVTRALYVSLVMLALASKRWAFPVLAALGFTALIAYDLYSSFTTLENIPWRVLATASVLIPAIWVPVGAFLATRKVEEHVEVMNTPLHLCPSCKKLRDDQSRWSRIEDYVMAELGREVASSFCPNCVVKWTSSRPQRNP